LVVWAYRREVEVARELLGAAEDLTGMCIAGMGFIVALRGERHEEDRHGFKGVSVYALVSGGFS
jgi:hypothetical protein